MSSELIRKTVAGIIADDFSPLEPDLPVFHENQPFTQPTGEPWAYVTVQEAYVCRADLSRRSPRYRREGVVNIQIMAPENSGTKNLREVCDSFSSVFTDEQFPLPGALGSITFYGYQARNRGVINGWLSWNAIFEFKAFTTTP